MTRSISTRHIALITLVILVATFLFGVIGLRIGLWYYGAATPSAVAARAEPISLSEGVKFNGQHGYEAYGRVGFGVGALVGGLLGCLVSLATIRARR